METELVQKHAHRAGDRKLISLHFECCSFVCGQDIDEEFDFVYEGLHYSI